MIRVGVIGAGGNTRGRHIPGLLAIDGVEITGICNRSVASAQVVCEQFGIRRAEEDAYTLLNDPSIDAIVIGTWPYKHSEYSIAALENGKHVMTEARMAMNATEAARMFAASEARPELVAQVVPSPFTLHYDALLRELIETQIGKLLAVRVVINTAAYADFERTKTWRLDSAYSGNNIMGIGIYYEALARWTGQLTSLQADVRTVMNPAKNPQTGALEPVDIPDHVNILGTFEKDNATLNLTASAIAGMDVGTDFWFVGTTGTIHLEQSKSTIRVGKKGESEMREIDIDAANLPGWRVEEEFIAAIRGDEKIKHTTFADGLHYMKFTDAIHESAKTGARIDLTPAP